MFNVHRQRRFQRRMKNEIAISLEEKEKAISLEEKIIAYIILSCVMDSMIRLIFRRKEENNEVK